MSDRLMIYFHGVSVSTGSPERRVPEAIAWWRLDTEATWSTDATAAFVKTEEEKAHREASHRLLVSGPALSLYNPYRLPLSAQQAAATIETRMPVSEKKAYHNAMTCFTQHHSDAVHACAMQSRLFSESEGAGKRASWNGRG